MVFSQSVWFGDIFMIGQIKGTLNQYIKRLRKVKNE